MGSDGSKPLPKRRKLVTSLPKTNVHGPWFREVVRLSGRQEASTATELFYQAPGIIEQPAEVAALFYQKMCATLTRAGDALRRDVADHCRIVNLCTECAECKCKSGIVPDDRYTDLHVVPCECTVLERKDGYYSPSDDGTYNVCWHDVHHEHLGVAVGAAVVGHLQRDLAEVVLDYLNLQF